MYKYRMELETSQYFISGIAQANAEDISIAQLKEIVCVMNEFNIKEKHIGEMFDVCLQAQVLLNSILKGENK